jgi:hypothetical protein
MCNIGDMQHKVVWTEKYIDPAYNAIVNSEDPIDEKGSEANNKYCGF